MALPQTSVEFAFGSGVGDAAPVFTDTTPTANPTLSLSTKRGRPYELSTAQPGTASATLDNRDGRYTPPGAPGTPYEGDVKLLTPVRIRASLESGGTSSYPGEFYPDQVYPGQDANVTTYSVWAGFVERWPQQWSNTMGQSPVQCIDILSVVAASKLRTVVVEELSVDKPRTLYTMSDTAAPFVDLASGRGGVLEHTGSGGTLAFASTSINADGELAAFTMTGGAGYSGGYRINIADQVSGPVLVGVAGSPWLPGVRRPGGYSGSEHWTIEATFSLPDVGVVPQSGGTIFDGLAATQYNTIGNGIRVDVAPIGSSKGTRASFVVDNAGQTAELNIFAAQNLTPNATHHVALTWDGTILTLYIDGASVGSIGRGSNVMQWKILPLHVGGGVQGDVQTLPFSGTIANVAVYGSAMLPARIQDHANASITGFSGETSGVRITRLMSYQPNPIPVHAETGQSQLAVAKGIAGSSILQQLQNVAQWENGELFTDASGALVFQARTSRYNQGALLNPFGDAEGEYPYTTLQVDYDTTYLYNDIQITGSQGNVALSTDVNGSQARYGLRSLTLTYGVLSNEETLDAANYLYGRYNEPHFRVSSMTLNPAANPDLYGVALGIDIGMQIAVNRRPPGGVPILGEYVVESIAHAVDAQAGTWLTTLELSPADVNEYWKLEDPVFGQIDVPSIAIAY